ncbi:hypothetical protein PMI03_00639 [Rhizobium sp. AP16]|nr:hypothetical protein PMI03_00639 [Rhizobium sp. AP16]
MPAGLWLQSRYRQSDIAIPFVTLHDTSATLLVLSIAIVISNSSNGTLETLRVFRDWERE